MSRDNESYRNNFGKRMAAARKRAGMNQAELADTVGIGRATLSRYERGDLTPPTDVLADLAIVFQPHDVSLEWLLYGALDDSDYTPPIRVKSFGSLVALRFVSGGTAEVLMTTPEVTRILRACDAFEASRAEPNQEAQEAIDLLLEHFSEIEESISLLADVPIAALGARLVPSIPDCDTRDDLSRWSVFGGMESPRSSPTVPRSDIPGGQGVRQDISGEGHQIAGGDIRNTGGVSIGRKYSK